MPANTVPARIGRFQTRLSRVVDIVASRVVKIPVPGHPGQTSEKTLWTGRLYRADLKTVDSIFDWESDGAFVNQRGVASPNDLSQFMRELSPDELDAARAALPENLKGDRLTAGQVAAQDRKADQLADRDSTAAVSDFRDRAAKLQR